MWLNNQYSAPFQTTFWAKPTESGRSPIRPPGAACRPMVEAMAITPTSSAARMGVQRRAQKISKAAVTGAHWGG
jgi:hypothetical protein